MNDDLIVEAREFLRSENAQYYDSSLIGALADALEAATRERDAAVAAIERVRAEASSVLMAENDPPNDWNMALDYLAKRIIAALDGAPEPEEKP